MVQSQQQSVTATLKFCLEAQGLNLLFSLEGRVDPVIRHNTEEIYIMKKEALVHIFISVGFLETSVVCPPQTYIMCPTFTTTHIALPCISLPQISLLFSALHLGVEEGQYNHKIYYQLKNSFL